MYRFIKRHTEFVYDKDIPQSGWLWEICDNAVYIAKAMVKVFKDVPINPHDLVEFYSCNSFNQSCMEDNCSACSVPIKLNMEDGGASSFSVFRWTKVEKKSRKISIHMNLTKLVNEFNTQVGTLKKHIFVKRCQNNYYNSLKNNLKCGQLLINVDYSKKYVNQEQQEIQSAYFGHECFSIFTACCYFGGTNGELVSLQNSCPYVYNEDNQWSFRSSPRNVHRWNTSFHLERRLCYTIQVTFCLPFNCTNG